MYSRNPWLYQALLEGIAVSRVVEKKDRRCDLHQMGEVAIGIRNRGKGYAGFYTLFKRAKGEGGCPRSMFTFFVSYGGEWQLPGTFFGMKKYCS